MVGNTSLQRGCCQKLLGRATSIRGTDLSLTFTHILTTTLVGISPSVLQGEVVRGLEVCCLVEEVGRVPCMDPGEGRRVPHDEGEPRHP